MDRAAGQIGREGRESLAGPGGGGDGGDDGLEKAMELLRARKPPQKQRRAPSGPSSSNAAGSLPGRPKDARERDSSDGRSDLSSGFAIQLPDVPILPRVVVAKRARGPGDAGDAEEPDYEDMPADAPAQEDVSAPADDGAAPDPTDTVAENAAGVPESIMPADNLASPGFDMSSPLGQALQAVRMAVLALPIYSPENVTLPDGAMLEALLQHIRTCLHLLRSQKREASLYALKLLGQLSEFASRVPPANCLGTDLTRSIARIVVALAPIAIFNSDLLVLLQSVYALLKFAPAATASQLAGEGQAMLPRLTPFRVLSLLMECLEESKSGSGLTAERMQEARLEVINVWLSVTASLATTYCPEDFSPAIFSLVFACFYYMQTGDLPEGSYELKIAPYLFAATYALAPTASEGNAPSDAVAVAKTNSKRGSKRGRGHNFSFRAVDKKAPEDPEYLERLESLKCLDPHSLISYLLVGQDERVASHLYSQVIEIHSREDATCLLGGTLRKILEGYLEAVRLVGADELLCAIETSFPVSNLRAAFQRDSVYTGICFPIVREVFVRASPEREKAEALSVFNAELNTPYDIALLEACLLCGRDDVLPAGKLQGLPQPPDSDFYPVCAYLRENPSPSFTPGSLNDSTFPLVLSMLRSRPHAHHQFTGTHSPSWFVRKTLEVIAQVNVSELTRKELDSVSSKALELMETLLASFEAYRATSLLLSSLPEVLTAVHFDRHSCRVTSEHVFFRDEKRPPLVLVHAALAQHFQQEKRARILAASRKSAGSASSAHFPASGYASFASVDLSPTRESMESLVEVFPRSIRAKACLCSLLPPAHCIRSLQSLPLVPRAQMSDELEFLRAYSMYLMGILTVEKLDELRRRVQGQDYHFSVIYYGHALRRHREVVQASLTKCSPESSNPLLWIILLQTDPSSFSLLSHAHKASLLAYLPIYREFPVYQELCQSLTRPSLPPSLVEELKGVGLIPRLLATEKSVVTKKLVSWFRLGGLW